jgi:hypothetical protein
MVTPLAPVTESMTPWAKTLVAAKAKRRMVDEYCILSVGDKGRSMKVLSIAIRDWKVRPAPSWNESRKLKR